MVWYKVWLVVVSIVIIFYLVLLGTLVVLRRSARHGNSKSALAMAMVMQALLPFYKNLPPRRDKTEFVPPAPKKGQRRKGQ
jgi:hypothetical protein